MPHLEGLTVDKEQSEEDLRMFHLRGEGQFTFCLHLSQETKFLGRYLDMGVGANREISF